MMQLRWKLSALCAALVIVPFSLGSAVLLFFGSSHGEDQARLRLEGSARAAAGLYQKRVDSMSAAAQRLGGEIANRALVRADNRVGDREAFGRLQDILPGAQSEFGLDFLVVAGPDGRVIARHNDRPAPGETLTARSNANPIAERVLAHGSSLRNSPLASSVVERGDRLDALGLRTLAQLTGAEDAVEALMIEAGAPIFSSGQLVGMVLIGQMLNNYSASRPGAVSLQVPLLVEVRDTLFADDGRGGVLIALGDTIVASSGFSRTGSAEHRFTAAKHDPSAREEKLSDGQQEWTVFWQPISAFDGSTLGAIGVAMASEDLSQPISGALNLVAALGLLALVAAAAAGYLFGRSLGLRTAGLAEAASRMALGELSEPIKDEAGGWSGRLPRIFREDEISVLSARLEEMRESFRQAVDRLRRR